MNHKRQYRQVFICGSLLNNYEKAKNKMKSPTPEEYDALPSDIKIEYPRYIDYKNAVDANNEVTKGAMKDKLREQKDFYLEYTGGSASDKIDFDIEADELIAAIDAKTDKKAKKIEN